MYTKEEITVRFIVKAFEGKKMKEDIPLFFHSISVGFMLKNIECNEETVLNGSLHDILEVKNIKVWKEIKIKFIDNLKKKRKCNYSRNCR